MLSSNAIGADAVGSSGSAQGVALIATLGSTSALTGAITSATTLTAFVAATAAAGGLLSTSIVLSSVVVSSASALAALSLSPQSLSAALTSTTSSLASLSTTISLSCIPAARSSMVATLSSILSAALSCNVVSRSSVQGTLTSQQAPLMFIPSIARTVSVQASSPLFVAGKFWNLTDPKKPRGVKDPNATIDVTFDWGDWLNDIGSPTISDITFTLTGADSLGSYLNDSKATVFVSGGVIGTVVSVACQIKTATSPSRTDERTVYLSIEEQ